MIALRVCFVTMVLTAIYLLISVEFSCLFFNNKANGSLIKSGNRVIGSRLIGQQFNSLNHFQGRPSSNKYKNTLSGNSNFPYYSNELKDFILVQSNNYFKLNGRKAPDLNSISESASGLDPHITISNALNQAGRISKNSEIGEKAIIDLINQKAKRSGFNNQKIVNVLELNLELEKMYAKKTRT